MRHIRNLDPWTTDAIVVLPEHMHMMWTLPANDSRYAQLIRMVKGLFTTGLRNAGLWRHKDSPWQARYWEHTIRDETDLENHVAYIHFNPVTHGHARAFADWPFSSFHRYVRDGWVAPDWSGGGDVVVSGD